jgi:hypothetical protein
MSLSKSAWCQRRRTKAGSSSVRCPLYSLKSRHRSGHSCRQLCASAVMAALAYLGYSRASASDPIQWSLSRAPSAGACQSRGFRQATATRLAPGGNPTTRRYGSFLPGKRELGQPATCIQRLANTNPLNGAPKRRPRLVFLPPASECRSSNSLQCMLRRICWQVRS